MVNQAVFDVTEKGAREIRLFMVNVAGDAKLILPLFVNGYTLNEVAEKLPPSARAGFDQAVDKLLEAGYIAPKQSTTRMAAVPAAVMPAPLRQLDHTDLDFTGAFEPFDEALYLESQASLPDEVLSSAFAAQEILKARAETEVLKQEIESRSQDLAASKIQQFEQDMNNTITLMAEHEVLQAEQEKFAKQQEMEKTARLSPIFDTLTQLDFFKDFSAVELAEVLHFGTWYEKEKHEVIMQITNVSSCFFVLMSGSAAVLKQTKLIGVVECGESFGDGFYLMGEKATHYANVIAKSHVEFLEFSTVELEKSSLEVRYQFARALARSQTRRFRRANEMIMSLLADKSHE